jgi:hypothetical protein
VYTAPERFPDLPGWNSIFSPIVDIPGVTKVRIFDINDSGVIVGWYQHGLATHGFMGTPVPEPASSAMVSLGLLLIVWTVKRRTFMNGDWTFGLTR